MNNPIRCGPYDLLYENVEEDVGGRIELFDEKLNELCAAGLVEQLQNINDDTISYKAKTGISWTDILPLDPIQKKILTALIDDPRSFFVLVNTQKGKLRITGKEIASWALLPDKRVVGFIVVDNDKTLSEQSVNGLFSCFPQRENSETATDIQDKYKVKIFELSSNNKTKLSDVITYLDAYAYNPSYDIPVIAALANNKQIEKLLRILLHTQTHQCPQLCAAGAWDEADKTYPQYREKEFSIGGHVTSYINIFNMPNSRLIRHGFVTATEGELLEDYDECTNAYQYPIEINQEDRANYFAFHHDECKIELVDVQSGESNNAIASRVLEENWDSHFNVPIHGQYYRKILINSNARANDMRTFAEKWCNRAHVLTFNMRGVTLYNSTNSRGKKYSTKKQPLNRLLFYIFKMNHLHDKPLLTLGRRKVDRGLGFHYAPRSNGHRITEIVGPDGVCHTNGVEGLIWTDMIMGNKIDSKATAVQKAGRGAGIIRQCPQYTGSFTYWIDADTAQIIKRHYQIVDAVNDLSGNNTIQAAMAHAISLVPNIVRNHDVDLSRFRVVHAETPAATLLKTKVIVETIFSESYRNPQHDETGKYKTSLNRKSEVVDLLTAIKKVPGSYGTNNGTPTYRRFLPCYHDMDDANSLCCVIPLIDPAYTPAQIERLDTEYADFLRIIPQEGEITL